MRVVSDLCWLAARSKKYYIWCTVKTQCCRRFTFFFLKKRYFQVLILLVLYLYEFLPGLARSGNVLSSSCCVTNRRPTWDDQTMVCVLLSWWCICNWFLVEALLWRLSSSSDVKLGFIPSIESVGTNLDDANDQMNGFLQRLVSYVPFSNILNHLVWWVVESGSVRSWVSLGRVVDSANPAG